ncbi:MAG: polyhydroxyalkanoate depolymerase [Magnetospirillum sp.]|nr:polyhydroxyalkanoate depolymerase [Magnetospirillum sp.]
MLYQIHELQRATFTPLRMVAGAIQTIYSHPWLPLAYTRFGRAMVAGAELVERATRRYVKPAFNLPFTETGPDRVPVREVVAVAKPFCTLLHFRREGVEGRSDPRVLVAAPLSGHFATLLRGTVKTLLPEHDVYITDWHDARDVPLAQGGFDLDDYIDYVTEFLRFLGPDTHVLAVCQPAVPVLAAVSLMAAGDDPCQPRSMVLMGGPIDTRISPTKVNEVATAKPLSWFERAVIHPVPPNHPGRGRRVYPGFLQLQGFMSMNLERHVGEHLGLFHNMVRGDGDSAEQHRKFYDEYLSVMDLSAEYYLQTIETVFQQHRLALGTMRSRGRPVDPSLIRRTALMTVEGERDDITGVGQTEAAHRLCPALPEALRRHHLQPKVGHYGVFNGRRWREEIYPDVRDFIRTHDSRAVLAQ